MSPKGEKPIHHRTKLFLGNPTIASARKEINSMPSPLGEGLTDEPIAQVNRGEVPKPLSRLPQGGEAKTS